MHRPLNTPDGTQQVAPLEHPVNLCSLLTASAEDQRGHWQHLQQLLDDAHKQHVHEIHIEPDEDCWRLRFRSPFSFTETRIDSIADYQQTLNQLLDHLWSSNDAVRPRRGWFEFPINATPWLLQLDIVTSTRGDSFMFTLLRPSKEPPQRLDALALSRKQHAQIRSILKDSHGLILVASDQSQPRLQTVRALLQELVSPDRKIVCADNPGHPLIPRTTQLAVDSPPTRAQKHMWTAMCELGCNVIVACQQLDEELDSQLVRYASKDTLVIQSTNATNAADAVDRMLSIGVRSEALARTLTAIVVQRQVQCVCRYCRQSQVPDDDGTAWLAEHSPIKAGNINDWLRHRMRSSFSQAEGCEKCSGTGRGAVLDIYDIVTIDDAVRDALYDADIRYALSILREQASLATHLLNLAQEGIISLTEAVRVAPLNASND